MAVSISLETDARLKWQMQEQLTTRLPEWFGQPESNRRYAAQAELLPGYDAAYNKAIPFADPDGPSHEEWTKILDINLTGPMLLTKAAAPALKRQGSGRIVNISSVAKAGLIHLTKCMAVALAPEVLVNCVAHGLPEGTRAAANLRPEQIEHGHRQSLLGEAADKDDVADQVVTMCRTDTMTGQTAVIDSGRTFH